MCLRIGIDLDGVIFDYVTVLRRQFGFTEDEAPDPFKWEIWECWGMSESRFWSEAHAAYDRHLFFRGDAYPGAIEALRELDSLGHTLHIVTARTHPVAQRDTLAWLVENNVPYHSIDFASDKTTIPVDVFIEDNLQNAEAIVATGMKAFLLDRPWNQGETEVPRVMTMTDFVAEVQHLEAQHCAAQESPETWVSENGEPAFRVFETGATRDLDGSKLNYEGFLSPLVLRRFAEYMNKNRTMADGSVRSGDNWQKGMPLESYMDSGWRHFWDWWANHRGVEAGVDIEEALCAVLFNVQGYLHEVLKEKEA